MESLSGKIQCNHYYYYYLLVRDWFLYKDLYNVKTNFNNNSITVKVNLYRTVIYVL